MTSESVNSKAFCVLPVNLDVPLIFACQGRANVAQLANDLALIMDHEGYGVICSPFLLQASDVETEKLSGKKIFVLEGCRKGCIQALLNRLGAPVNECIALTDLGIESRVGESCSYSQMNQALRVVQKCLASMCTSQISNEEV